MIEGFDLICFSHLRWDFVFQRPQHLLTRFAKTNRVFYVEEPVYEDIPLAKNKIENKSDSLFVVKPHLPLSFQAVDVHPFQKKLVNDFIRDFKIRNYVSWYYTPMALPFTSHLDPRATVYDCMDELTLFKNAPARLAILEEALFKKADVVFTGGHTLYEAKKYLHDNIFPFPSSIDKFHFEKARKLTKDAKDQKEASHPRLGFFGVIDERFDLKLLSEMATLRPQWNFMIIGPVVKIDPKTLPQKKNIHYLGPKPYSELPQYIAGWDVALLLFALNDSTRFISPTKTPEYLAAGKPVVSSAIKDVVFPYGKLNLVHIASTPLQFVRACEESLYMKTSQRERWLKKVDDYLVDFSWDKTWAKMASRVNKTLDEKKDQSLYFPHQNSEVFAPPSSVCRTQEGGVGQQV